jgi:plastocyanin
VEGTITVKKLTKPRVTAFADEYGRTDVELGAEATKDPLAYERSHVVIYLEGEKLESRAITATMEQKNRRFLPDLVVIPAGSTVSFPNLDEIFHDVFSLSKPRSFDLGNSAQHFRQRSVRRMDGRGGVHDPAGVARGRIRVSRSVPASPGPLLPAR